MIEVKTVAELIHELEKHAPAAKVCATWEGQDKAIVVYAEPDGTVVLDVN